MICRVSIPFLGLAFDLPPQLRNNHASKTTHTKSLSVLFLIVCLRILTVFLPSIPNNFTGEFAVEHKSLTYIDQ